ncbi:MAG: hypothetical protein U9N81_10105 [Bacillota bacterium]|nr:hypothetical protein [Bacillota bacterium]
MDKNYYFTGIVSELGKVSTLELSLIDPGVYVMQIKIKNETFLKQITAGNHLLVNGVCLTVAEISNQTLEVHIWPHTQTITNLLQCKPGNYVNLEKAQTGARNQTRSCPLQV